jgi:hypothetical protein
MREPIDGMPRVGESTRPLRGRCCSTYDRAVTGEPTTFFMHLPEAVLAFERGMDGYSVYSLPASDRTLPKDEWDALRPRLQPTGRIPLDEVEFDDDARIIRLDTMGIERFIAG